MGRASQYPPELRERAVRMVAEVTPAYPSLWAAITAVAQKLGGVLGQAEPDLVGQPAAVQPVPKLVAGAGAVGADPNAP